MTENKLRNMIENHGLDTLINNSEEIERLKKTETTKQVLEILKKYNYEESAEVFEKELLEILHSIELNEEDMKKVSGGKTKNTKYLSAVLGGLVAINGVVALPASASTEREEKIESKSFLNKVDKSDAKKIGGGSTIGVLGTALVWIIKEVATKKSKQQMCDRAELYEMFHPDLAEHLPAKTIPYLKAVDLYLSYQATYLEDKLGKTTIKDLKDKALEYLAENVIFEAAMLAGQDVGLHLTPEMVQRAIKLDGQINMDATTITIEPDWREHTINLLYIDSLLDNISLSLPEDHTYTLRDIYYQSGQWAETAGDCKGKYKEALCKATRIIKDKYSSFNDTRLVPTNHATN